MRTKRLSPHLKTIIPGKVAPGGSNSVANPWQYTGGYYDSATKLVKMGQRYYDPSLGRFTQLDPKGGGYTYAGDNPTTFVDPLGLDVCVSGNVSTGFGTSSSGGTCSNNGQITSTSVSAGTSLPPCPTILCGSISISNQPPSSSGTSLTSNFSSGSLNVSNTIDPSGNNNVNVSTTVGSTTGSPDPSVGSTIDFTTTYPTSTPQIPLYTPAFDPHP